METINDIQKNIKEIQHVINTISTSYVSIPILSVPSPVSFSKPIEDTHVSISLMDLDNNYSKKN